MSRPFVSTSFLTLIGRSGGLILPFVVAGIYGSSPLTDAFFFSYSITFLFIIIFSHLFEAFIIPYLAEQQRQGESVTCLVNGLFVCTLPVIGVSCLFLFYFLFWLTDGSRSGPEFSSFVGRFFLEMTPFLLFAIMTSAANSIFFIKNNFWFPAISPLVRSAVAIPAIIFFHKDWPVQALTMGLFLGEGLRFAGSLILLIQKTSWKPELDWTLIKKFSKNFWFQAGFQISALMAVNLIPVSDQWFASWLGGGAVSLFNYSDRLLQIPYILFMSSILQIFLTDWAKEYQTMPQEKFWNKVQNDIQVVFWVGLCLGILFWAGRHFIVINFYRFSQLTRDELFQISEVFGWLSVAFIPGVIRLLYGRLLFVMKKSSLYCVQSCLELISNVALNAIFIQWYGLNGIAMATACTYLISAAWLYFYFQKQWAHNFKGAY